MVKYLAYPEQNLEQLFELRKHMDLMAKTMIELAEAQAADVMFREKWARLVDSLQEYRTFLRSQKVYDVSDKLREILEEADYSVKDT